MGSLRHCYLALIGFLGWMGVGAFAGAACPPLSRAGLDAYLKEHGPTEVHFFASWCVECVRHIRESPPKGVIFIATFDERPSAEKAFEKLDGKAPCFFDDGIAEALQIKAVPTIRKMQLP